MVSIVGKLCGKRLIIPIYVLSIVFGSVGVAVADENDKTGTNPVNFQDEIRIYNEYSWLNTEGDGNQNMATLEFRTPFSGGKFQYRLRARHVSLGADFDDDGSDDVNDAGVGDLDMRVIYVPYLKGKWAFATSFEMFFNSASDPSLGSGTTSLGPQAFLVRFFRGGFGPYQGGLFAPGTQYKFSVEEDPGRSKTEQILVDLNFLMMGKSKKHWFFTDPQIVRDLENNLEFALIDIEFGFMMPKQGQSMYVRPTFSVGNDRPTDYGLELGYKFVGFEKRGEPRRDAMSKMTTVLRSLKHLLLLVIVSCSAPLAAADKPNIVLVFMDNFGWGEIGAYGGGILRGAPTPRIDSLAEEGMKLLNFNVESQCVPSRSAIMTGRYAIRSGTSKVPLGSGLYGMTQWEYTMAEMLSDAGYATGMFGKWHLGDSPGRYPTDQGFDEWYGIPNTTDESFWPDNDLYRPGTHPQVKFAHVMESKKGEAPKELAVYDLAERATIDGKITERSVDFIKRKAKGDKPFFLYIPYTQTHFPVTPSPEFDGKTGNGNYADVLAQLDHYVGQLLDTVDRAGIADNTIFIFTSDNGPEGLAPHEGFGGPWRGSYFTGLEGSLRVPFLIRWPGRIPARTVSNEITHEMDLFATFANIAGGRVPDDRVMDSVDLTDFLMGKRKESGRESVVIYNGTDIYGVKWRNWKMMIKEIDGMFDMVAPGALPAFYNLLQDPKEMRPERLAPDNLWIRYPASQVLIDHAISLKKEPPIKEGTPDPYTPPKG